MSTEDWSWVRHWTDLLYQDEVWRDAQGQVLRLDDMEPGYCSSVRAFCLRQADDVFHLIGMQYASAPSDMSDSTSWVFEREFDRFLGAGNDPQAWLDQSDLLTALKFRSEGLPARPSVCHCGYPFVDADDEPWDHGACVAGIIVD
ncbi:hypothetical protein [Streptomyces sp. NPDC058297]|uniref:hypothetical protein n=1 Tax=Streptomyces sp. NPDC058297 TaxID=3346433 RepID=UPI0036EAFBEB